MDLTRIAQQLPWLWPSDIDSTLLALLRDRQADELERLQAAEMAGEVAIINDDLAGALLSVVGNANASEDLRTRAALSLGPVLEHMDIDRIRDDADLDDTLDAPPISEHSFHRIQQSLRARYQETDIPKEVRRRIFEASVRAPADWHPDAVRAAYSSEDRGWRLTAVFAMRWVAGFGDEIVAALDDPDDEIRYKAVWAAGNWEIDGTWPHVSALLSAPNTDKALLLAAIDAAVSINPHEAKPLLAELTDSQDTDIADAADIAMMMAATPFDDAFDHESEL